MGRYLRSFDNHTQYTTFTGTSEFVKPNVSLCKQEMELHYNPDKVTINSVLVNGNEATIINPVSNSNDEVYLFTDPATQWSYYSSASTNYTIVINGSNLQYSSCTISGMQLTNYYENSIYPTCTINSVNANSTQVTVNVSMNKSKNSGPGWGGVYVNIVLVFAGMNEEGGDLYVGIQHNCSSSNGAIIE